MLHEWLLEIHRLKLEKFLTLTEIDVYSNEEYWGMGFPGSQIMGAVGISYSEHWPKTVHLRGSDAYHHTWRYTEAELYTLWEAQEVKIQESKRAQRLREEKEELRRIDERLTAVRKLFL